MSINGISNAPPSTGGSPTMLVAELVTLLREARQVQRESENSLSDAAVGAAMDRAELARDKAEASRGHAWLQFAMSASSAATSIGSSLATSQAEDMDAANAVSGRVESAMNHLSAVGEASDNAFGSGWEAEEAAQDMEQASANETLYNALQDRVRTTREATEDALADARQAYRELNNA